MFLRNSVILVFGDLDPERLKIKPDPEGQKSKFRPEADTANFSTGFEYFE